MEEDKGLTIPQVAEKIGKSSRQVRRYILDGSLPARTIQGKFGPEYRIDDIPEALYRKDQKMTTDTLPREEIDKDTSLALQMLDSIESGYKAKITELEAVNLNLAIELGKERARREELENRVKLLPGPAAPSFKPFFKRIVGRFLK